MEDESPDIEFRFPVRADQIRGAKFMVFFATSVFVEDINKLESHPLTEKTRSIMEALDALGKEGGELVLTHEQMFVFYTAAMCVVRLIKLPVGVSLLESLALASKPASASEQDFKEQIKRNQGYYEKTATELLDLFIGTFSNDPTFIELKDYCDKELFNTITHPN